MLTVVCLSAIVVVISVGVAAAAAVRRCWSVFSPIPYYIDHSSSSTFHFFITHYQLRSDLWRKCLFARVKEFFIPLLEVIVFLVLMFQTCVFTI